VAVEAVLREGDDLEGDPVLYLFAELKKGAEGEEFFFGDVGVSSDEEDALLGLEAEGAGGALFDVVEREVLLEAAPDLDAFEEGAGLVEAAAGVDEGGIEVDVRFDEGWGDEEAVGGELGDGGYSRAGIEQAFDLAGCDQKISGDGFSLPRQKQTPTANQERRGGHVGRQYRGRRAA